MSGRHGERLQLPGIQPTPASPARSPSILSMMTKHHRGALAMAKVELAKGKDKDAKALAQSIQDSQTKAITEMGSLLTKVQEVPAT